MLYVCTSHNSDSDCQTILTSQKIIHDPNRLDKRRILQCLTALCGRFNYALADLSVISSAFEVLITQISQSSTWFTREELSVIIRSIAFDTPLPLQFFSEYVRESQDEQKSLIISRINPLDRRKVYDKVKLSVKTSLCRSNQSCMIQIGLISKICEDLWNDEDTKSSFQKWNADGTLTALALNGELLSNAKLVSQVLQIEWLNIEFPPSLVENLVSYSLFFVERILLSEETRNSPLMHYFMTIHHKSMCLTHKVPLNSDTGKKLISFYKKLISEYFDSSLFLNTVELFVGVIPWLGKEEKKELIPFANTLWNCIFRLLDLLASQPSENDSQDTSVVETVPIVTLASPEDDSPTPLSDDIQWLETMFCTIPLDLDKKAADELQRSHRKEKIRSILLDLISALPPCKNNCHDEISLFFKKMHCENFFDIPTDLLGKSVSSLLMNISPELQARLASECFDQREPNRIEMMKFLLTFNNTPEEIARTAIDSCITHLMDLSFNVGLIPIYQDDINLLKVLRSFISTDIAKNYASKLFKIVIDDNIKSESLSVLERWFHCFYIFLNTSSTDFIPSSLKSCGICFEDLKCSQEDMSKAVRIFASISSKTPSYTYPVYMFPFFTSLELEEEEDVSVLSHMFRLIPFIFSECGKKFTADFYKNNNSLIEKYQAYYSPKNFPSLLVNLLKKFISSLDSICEHHYAVFDSILIGISYDVEITVDLIEQIAVLFKQMEIYTITDSHKDKSQKTYEKLLNALQIARNPILLDVGRYKSSMHEAISSTVWAQCIDEKPKKSSVNYSNSRFFINKKDYPEMEGKLSPVLNCFVLLRSELISYLLKKKTEIDLFGKTFDEMITVFVQACSSQFTSQEDSDDLASYLHNVDTSLSRHLSFVIGNLMIGVTNASPVDDPDIETRPLTLIYALAFIEFFVSDRFGAHRWPQEVFKIIGDTLDKCADSSLEDVRFLPVLASTFKKIFAHKQSKYDACLNLKEIIASRISLLPRWIKESMCSSAFIGELSPVLTEIVDRKMISVEVLASYLEECVEYILSPDLVEQLTAFFPLELQGSDRFLHSQLKFVGITQKGNYCSSYPFATYGLGRSRLIFNDALQVLCKYGNTETHRKILQITCNNLHRWIGVSAQHGDALKGKTLLERNDHFVIFRLMVSSALISYLTELSVFLKNGSTSNDPDYFSDSESIRKMLSRKITLQNNVSSLEPSANVQPASYCTYLSSEQQFVQQHWYNCYTCKMTESVGVCTVCAMNCHRGHEVVYSKFGPFFCDCGARGCSSLREVTVNCTPLNACRGRILATDMPNETNEIKEVQVFEIPKAVSLSEDLVRSEFKRLFESLNESWEQIKNLIDGTIESKRNQWNLNIRRDEARQSMISAELKIKYKEEFMNNTFLGLKHHLNFSTMKRETPSNDARSPSRARDISGLVTLENGFQLWVVAESSTLYIHHIHVNENLLDELELARIDTESLPFFARRLVACEEKVCIMGKHDVLLLRFGKDGEIIDRSTIALGDDTLTNPLVKVTWCPGRPGMVAIATMQFLRIFDITQDLTQFIEELVLPVGNVEDIQMFEDSSGVKVLVLSSIGHVYRHKLISSTPQNNSYFMTNYMDNRDSRDAGNAVSFHYSPTTQLLFVAFDEATYVTSIARESITNEEVSVIWSKLAIEGSLHCWQEVNGVIAALPTKRMPIIDYFYCKEDVLMVQEANQRQLSPYCHILLSGADNETVFGLSTYFESTAVILSKVKWTSLPDFWIENMPIQLKTLPPVINEDPSEDLPREQLPLMMEKCELIEKIDVSSPDLAKFYESVDIETRLKTAGSWALTISQVQTFNLIFRVSDPNMVVRAIRIETPGSKGPDEVSFLGTTVSLESTSARFFDILLTRTESLNLDQNNIVLTFNSNLNNVANSKTYASILSVRLFGISRRAFGYPKSNTVLTNPLSLPESSVYCMMRFFAKVTKYDIQSVDKDKMFQIGKNLCSFCDSHQDIAAAANQLLRAVAGKNILDYYDTKDTVILEDIAKCIKESKHLSPSVLAEIVKQLKLMTCTRVNIFFDLVDELMEGPFALIEYLHSQLYNHKGDIEQLLEIYVALTFIFLSSHRGDTKRISQLFLSIFTDEKLCHLAHKVRLIAQTQVYSYSMNTRNDRTISRTLSTPLRVLKWGGLRPFFQKSKIIRPDELACLSEDLMGATMSSDELNSSDMFDLEAKFMIELLNDVLIKIRDEGHLCSMPKRGTLISRNDAVPATSLLIFAIVLMAQLYPTKLFPTVVNLIEMVKWDQPSSEITEENFRQFLLVRLISVLLTKCGEHIENKKKSLDKDGEKKGKPSMEYSVTMSLSSPGTPCPEGKTTDTDEKLDPMQDDRAANKRRSTEKLLEQVVLQLSSAGVLKFCLAVVKSLIPYWRVTVKETKIVSKLWARDRSPLTNDLTALSGTNYGKPGAMDSYEHFYAMITDVALRLPYQMKKIYKALEFDYEWLHALCELVTFHKASQVRRQSKKLLIALCNGEKQNYRTIRDRHLMMNNLELLKKKVAQSTNGALSHKHLTEIMELVTLLKSSASERPTMWREVCENQVNWLMQFACRISGPVSNQILELLVLAIRDSTDSQENFADKLISDDDSRGLLKMLLVRYLIGKDDNGRWQLHGMMRSTIQLASRQNQIILLRILLNELWPLARGLGSHGSQLADLLACYAPRLLTPSELQAVYQNEVVAINELMRKIEKEGHADTYKYTTGLGLGWKFMLMVNSPCLNCFSRKDSHESLKLNQIKLDARFSSNAMMIKLLAYYEISKVVVKLTDVKSNKIVKRVNLFYCPKMVESPVELKTNPKLWQKAGTATGTSGDGEIVISLALPIVASSLVIQFSEITVSGQDNELHCPRCSAVVPPNPGVCENCGENAFQCVKCRSINYDERDPFLCQSCGYCKYARMDISVLCRPLPGVQTITSDAERNNAVDMMSRLLIDIEQSRAQLHFGRSLCEALAVPYRPLPVVDFHMENPTKAESLLSSMPHLAPAQHPFYGIIQVLHYCKNAHEDLCTQTQQLIAYREELRRYDLSTSAAPMLLHQAINPGFYSRSAQCFGCICACILHSMAILQGIAEDASCADMILADADSFKKLVKLGQMYDPLLNHCDEFILRLAFENELGAQRLCELTMENIVRPQILAKSVLDHNDSYWQIKLKTLVKYAIHSEKEDATLSFLTLVDRLLQDGKAVRRKIYRKRLEHIGQRKATYECSHLRRKIHIKNEGINSEDKCAAWLGTDVPWRKLQPSAASSSLELLKEHEAWFWTCAFSPKITVRAAASKIIHSLSRHPGHLGVSLCMMLRGLSIAASVPSHMTDHFFRYAHLIIQQSQQAKIRLFKYGFHLTLMDEIYKECKKMYDEEEQETSMDLDFGLLLRSYTELLSIFLSGSSVELSLLKASRDHILIPLLHSTIFLKRVVFRRTRSLDSARMALESLLRRLSSKDPIVLLNASIESLSSEALDFYTQAQVVSLVMDVVDPEQQKEEDFLITIEKDPAQEDFLQGRMTGNPYKSCDPGLGPLMRDIKNKICRDTEMVALLEDDNGMELLINNQIISLSLPVAAVYEKLWRKSHPGQPMTIVYRMRGLLGDAVEPFVNSLNEEGDEEHTDIAASTIVEAFILCGGLDNALNLIGTCNVSTGGRLLLTHMKRLIDCIAKSEQGRQELVRAGAIATFMKILRLCVDGHENDESILAIGLDYLDLMGALVSDISTHPYLGNLNESDAKWLVDLTMRRKITEAGLYPDDWKLIHLHLMTSSSYLLGNLVLGNPESEDVLVAECKSTLNWVGIDESQTNVDPTSNRTVTVFDVEILAKVIEGILSSEFGKRLKSKILESGVISGACEYLLASHPPLYSATESTEWKAFLVKPSLRLMLQFMASMARNHEPTQLAISEKSLHIMHRLEQVASDNSIGTLAENVVEALKENKEVAAKIEAVRLETKQKKRQMAMAMRNKQLSKMGMQIGKSGEVKVAARKIANEPILDEVADPLSACCICREPLLTGSKIAAAYAFAVPMSIEPMVSVLTSVSQMVLVHIDCHQGAIRRSGGPRNTGEWAKASLHNAGAKCNCMTPIATNDAISSSEEWEMALARYQGDLDVLHATPLISRPSVFTDMCLLIDRFISFGSFSEKSQGGGRESNAQYLAILHLLACSLEEEELSIIRPRWTLYSFLMTELSLESWNEQRADVLRGALEDAITITERSWAALKQTCLAWAFVDGYFKQVIPITGSDRVEWLRGHLLETFRVTLTFVSWFDNTVAKIEDPKSFAEVLALDYEDFDAFFPPVSEES